MSLVFIYPKHGADTDANDGAFDFAIFVDLMKRASDIIRIYYVLTSLRLENS